MKIAVDEAGLTQDVSIYSADVSTADIAAMREPDSAWEGDGRDENPAVVGEVSVRALAMNAGRERIRAAQVIVPPTLITQDFLNEKRHHQTWRTFRRRCPSSPMPMSR